MTQPLYAERHSLLAGDQQLPELVLLHGWGIDSRIWSGVLPLLAGFSQITLIDLPGFGRSNHLLLDKPGEWFDAVLQVAPPRAVYLGFSLGGMLAVQLARQFPARVSGLISIASNACFVANENWLPAMEECIFDAFFQLCQKQPAVAVKRFLALQAKSCESERELSRRLKSLCDAGSLTTQALINGLAVLAAMDNRLALSELQCPSLHIYGDADELVPVAAAQSVKQLGVDVEVIAGASHVPFISHRDLCCASIKQFLRKHCLLPADTPNRLDKIQVARSFSRAASTYDEVAILQRRVGNSLLDTMPVLSTQVCVDLGCGTGFYLDKLIFQPGGMLLAFDLAEGMLRYVKHRHKAQACVCGDAEKLPFSDASVDCIFSSLAIQWCEDNPALFSEIYRVLKPGGKMFFSTLGPATLAELKLAWSAVDKYVHVNRFASYDDLQEAAISAGFDALQLTEEIITLEYSQLKNLTRELKGIGAHNMNEGRPAGLTGRKRIKQLLTAYESQRNENGLLPATYQVWYGVLEK